MLIGRQLGVLVRCRTNSVWCLNPSIMKKPMQQPSIDQGQTLKAVRALLQYVERQSEKEKEKAKAKGPSLLAEASADISIYLVFTTVKYISEHRRLKPARIALKHAIHAKDSAVCLIAKDPQRQYKELVKAASIEDRVSKVVGVTKLKGKYKTFEARRKLRDGYDVFLADSRVSPLLPNLLGKTFISRKKLPLPIDFTEKSTPAHLKKEVEQALNSTLVHLAPGTCTSIKIGLSSFSAEELDENIQVVVDKMTKAYIPNGFEGLKGIHIKTPLSTSLPIWLSDLL